MHAPAPVTAVVPLKALAAAKGRLATHLPPPRRRELAAWMFAHVVGVCLRSPSIREVLVVAGDAEAAALARRCSVRAVVQADPGLDAALGTADALLAAAAATLVVPADLPLLAVADVEAVCAAGCRAPAVVVAPTADGGTGALLRRPAGLMATAYGPGSALAHRRLAAEAGVDAAVITAPGFTHDVDTPRQLRAARLAEPRLARWAG